jgi:hypothetical protein
MTLTLVGESYSQQTPPQSCRIPANDYYLNDLSPRSSRNYRTHTLSCRAEPKKDNDSLGLLLEQSYAISPVFVTQRHVQEGIPHCSAGAQERFCGFAEAPKRPGMPISMRPKKLRTKACRKIVC